MRRSLSLLTATILAAGALAAPSVRARSAQAAPAVPAEPIVTDPTGDANYLNDQGDGSITSDNETPADASSVGDLMAAWYTVDAQNISLHIQTEAPAPASTPLAFRTFVDPGADKGCLEFEARTPGAPAPTTGSAWLDNLCDAEAVKTEGTLVTEEAADGTGILTVTIPRSAHASFAANGVLKTLRVTSRQFPAGQVTAPQIDTTKAGTDYKVPGGGGVEPEPEPKPEPKPSVPKKCKKLKGKARAKCIKKSKKVCKPYVPGEAGAEAETVKVTDKATAEAPVEVILPLDPGAGQGTGTAADAVTTALQSHAYYNVQVDSKAKETGLFVSLASPRPDDNDLYLLHSTGTEAAHAAGFHGGGPVPIYDSNADGGHTGPDAEFLDGIRTADCGGYTVHAVGANSRGGDVALQFWLGDPSDYEVPAP